MIPFYDLQKINAQYGDELQNATQRVISSGNYIFGHEVQTFENNFAHFISTKYAVGVGNGYDALRLIFRACIELGKIKPGDEVILPANTFIATALAVSNSGLTPILVDPDITTYNLNLNTVEQYVTSRTRAIVVVHLYGRTCWNEGLIEFANRYGLYIIEDNAQAFGATYRDHHTGSLGHAAAHSFYPTKPLGALGDAGAVTTNSIELASMVYQLSNYGSNIKYVHNILGDNSRLDKLQAALLNVKLQYANKELLCRRAIALYYIDRIKNDNVILPLKDFNSAWHLFVIRVKDRVGLQKYLGDNGIQTLIHYPIPIHKQLAYITYNSQSLPIAEQLSKEVLSLPLSSVMTLEEADIVINTINQWKG